MGMIDKDKVLIGLGQHISGRTSERCMACPYFNGDSGYGISCRDELLDDLYELLEAHEPRVMTVDELQALQRQDVVWLEDVDKEAVIPGIVVTAYKKEWQFATFIGYSGLFCVSCVDYGKRWRCWTSRPSDGQREATPWM